MLAQLKSCGVPFALTGGLAITARLREVGARMKHKPLNDLDIVVSAWNDLPENLSTDFLVNHIHPCAAEGKLLLQLVNPEHRLRIDVFRQFGKTLTRAAAVPLIGNARLVSVEDLRARATAHVCSSVGQGIAIDRKHVDSFCALSTVGGPQQLIEAWMDHRETVDGTIQEATVTAQKLIRSNPHLIITEEYGVESAQCTKCQPIGHLVLADRDLVASILGYA